MLNLDYDRKTEETFAVVETKKGKRPLKVRFEGLNRALKDLEEVDSGVEQKHGHLEFFAAGRGRGGHSFGHESIEDALSVAGFTDARIRRKIYFGNWLRDHSQFIDTVPLKVLTRMLCGLGSPPASVKSEPRKLLTAVVRHMADEHFQGEFTPRVTTETLGVYRWEEHVDNPTGREDSQAWDPDLNGPVFPGDVVVDERSLRKVYIGTVLNFIAKELTAAAHAGRTDEGYRHFGTALHPFEDIFSHSNMVELILRMVTKSKDIFPWTAIHPSGHYPLVTGTFGSLDTVETLSLQAVEKLTDLDLGNGSGGIAPDLLAQATDPKLSFWSRIMAGAVYQQAAQAESQLAVARGLLDFVRDGLAAVAREASELSTRWLDREFDPIRTSDPTHAELAKDHDDHPLHELAVGIAKLAIADVGQRMAEVWDDGRSPAHVILVVYDYFQHPLFQSERARPLFALAETWAAEHPAGMKRLAMPVAIKERREEHMREHEKMRARLFGAVPESPRTKALDAYLGDKPKAGDGGGQ
jgi:hypothetical protein